MTPVPSVTVTLAAALLVAVLVSYAVGRRGGHFRSLPGWAVFWAFFAPLLVLLSRTPRSVSLPVLGVFMFFGLREFFFVAPLRPRDRWALLLAYLSIPLVLWPELRGAWSVVLVMTPLVLFLVLPILLVAGRPQGGTFEATGRLFVGLLAFVFCGAHLGIAAGELGRGEIELFGILVLAAELPQRLAGRVRPAEGMLRPLAGVVAGVAMAAATGAVAGRLAGLSAAQGIVAGVLVAAGAAGGAFLAEASAQDLSLGAPTSRVGRGALLDRTFPAMFAAPLFVHYTVHLLAIL